MATRSTITLSTPQGYDTIYCHWDGHTSDVGKILKNHYSTLEKVQELIALGALSSLDRNIEPEDDVDHSFDKPANGTTVAYHRDRGEGTEPSISHYDHLAELYDNGEDYNYVFEDDEWHLLDKQDHDVYVIKPYSTKD